MAWRSSGSAGGAAWGGANLAAAAARGQWDATEQLGVRRVAWGGTYLAAAAWGRSEHRVVLMSERCA